MDPIILIKPEELKRLIESAVRTALGERLTQDGPSPEGPLTMSEAAAYLNISLSTLYRYTSQRVIPHHRPGKVIYIYREELDAWLAEHRKLTRKQIEEGAEIPLVTSKKAPIVPIKQKGRKAS